MFFKRFCKFQGKSSIIAHLVFSMMLLLCAVLLSSTKKVELIIILCVIMLIFIIVWFYELFFSESTIVYEDKVETFCLVKTDLKDYKNKLFKPVVINYCNIKFIERRTMSNKIYLYFYTLNDELITVGPVLQGDKVYNLLKKILGGQLC